MFLLRFNSLKTAAFLPSFVLLQDPPVDRNCLTAFAGFKAFAPEIRNSMAPKVAYYVFYGFLQIYPIVPLFFNSPDWMALDVHTPSGLFDSNHHVLRIYNSYSTNGSSSNICTFAPEQMFSELDFPCLIASDFNIHTPLSDPLRDFSPNDIAISAPYFERTADMGFSLLNTPGVYTRFPFVAGDRHAVLDLSFANTELAPFFTSWLSHLPSTGSDHIPIMLTLSAPLLRPMAASPNWEKADWTTLTPTLQQVSIPAPPPLPTKASLSAWFDRHLSVITSLLSLHTPLKRPSLHSKSWWTETLSRLYQELHEAQRAYRREHTPPLLSESHA